MFLRGEDWKGSRRTELWLGVGIGSRRTRTAGGMPRLAASRESVLTCVGPDGITWCQNQARRPSIRGSKESAKDQGAEGAGSGGERAPHAGTLRSPSLVLS